MDNSVRIDPSFQGVINLTPCTCIGSDCFGLTPHQATRLQDAFNKTLGISSPKDQCTTFLTLTKRLSVADTNQSFILLAQSVAMEKLVGKDKAEALASTAPALIRKENWNDVVSLVNKIRDTGDDVTKYKLAIIKSICEKAPKMIPLALNLADDIEISQEKIETLVAIAKDQAKRGLIENAKLIKSNLCGGLLYTDYSPEKIKTFLSHFDDAIKAAEALDNTKQFEQVHSKWEQNEAVFNRLKKEIEDAFASKNIPYSMQIQHQASPGKDVLETLGLVAAYLMQYGMTDQVFVVLEAIQNELVDDESEKADLIADIVVTLAFQEGKDDHIARFITHGRQDTVDVNLVKEIVKHFTTKRSFAKALAIAEQYLKGKDLTEAFDIFAQSLDKFELHSLRSLPTILHSSHKEKGNLFVALVGVLAKKKVQKALDFIEEVRNQDATLEQNPPQCPISEEDLSEAYIRVAQAKIMKDEILEEVLAELALHVSQEKTTEAAPQYVQKAYIQLADELLDSKIYWNHGIKVLDHISATIPRDDLDRLLAKAAIAETEVLVKFSSK